MRLILLTCCGVISYLYAAVVTIVFELHLPFFLAGFLLLGKGRFDDAMRIQNVRYGAFLARSLRPILRIRSCGIENVPDGPVMLMVNHRCSFDIMFMCLVAPPNLCVLLRTWPLKLPVMGWFMRRGRYVDVERSEIGEMIAVVKEFAARGVSWVCFPEGHRSRDGRLRRFRSGGFILAVESGLPIVPVCIAGSERFCPPGSVVFRPATVNIEVLPAIDPASFPDKRRALKVRRHVEQVFKEHLGD